MSVSKGRGTNGGLAVGWEGRVLTVGVLGGVPVPTGTDVVEDSAGGAEVTVLEQVGFRDVDSDTSNYELFAVGERHGGEFVVNVVGVVGVSGDVVVTSVDGGVDVGFGDDVNVHNSNTSMLYDDYTT